MKLCPASAAALLAALIPSLLHGEETAAAALVASVPDSLVVPEFSPPAKVAPKQIPTMRIDAATTYPLNNGKTLTLLRGEASTLPDPPPKPILRPVEPRPRTAEDEARATYQRRHTLNLGATVYDRRVSVVRWQHPDTGESYEAVCGFDISLIGGLGRFVRGGESYSVMLMHSHLDTTRPRKVPLPHASALSAVTADSITYLRGDPADAIGTAPVTLVKELIANEKTRLEIFQADLARHHAARAAWEKAHPEPPRDKTFWIRPLRGSRYLTEPTPEVRTR